MDPRHTKRQRRGGALACIVAIATVVGAAGAAVAATTAGLSHGGRCARAFALYEAHYYGKAARAYGDLVGSGGCATRRDVARARRAAAAAATNAAILLEQARTARKAGFESRSRAAVERLVRDDPETPVPADLRAPGQRLGFWQGFLGVVGPVLHFAAEALIALLAATVLMLLPLLIARSIRDRWRRSMLLVPFVGAHADDVGQAVVSALREHIAQLRSARPSRSLYFASGGESDFGQLPEAIGSAFPQAGVVAALLTLLGRLGPRRLWRVTGTLLPADPVRGVGITLCVAKHHEPTFEQITLWERDYHAPTGAAAKGAADGDALLSRYQRLALPAAVWLAYRPTLGFEDDTPPMGTREWRSYARFAVGEVAQACGDEGLAGRLYREALDLDPANLGARTNLAALLLAPVPGETEEARGEREALLDAQVEHVIRHRTMQVPVEDPAPEDPLWYRIHYLEAISRLYAGKIVGARFSAGTLVRAIAQRMGEGPGSLKPLLERMWFPARVLQANVAVEAAPSAVRAYRVAIPRLLRSDWTGAAGHYNLACHFARKLRRLEADITLAAEQEECRTLALSHLREAVLYGDAGAKPSARTDPAFKVLHTDPTFRELVPDDDEDPTPADADGQVRATFLHGTLVSVQSGKAPDGEPGA